MENLVHLVSEVVSISQLLTQEWSKNLLSACILPMNQICNVIWSMYNTRQTGTREKGTTFFSCFYLTSSPTTHLATMRDIADMKQKVKKCQLKKMWKSRLRPRSRKKETRWSAAEDKGRDRLQHKNFLSKWLGNRNNILKSFCCPMPPTLKLQNLILFPSSGQWIVLTWNGATHIQSFSLYKNELATSQQTWFARNLF